MYPSFGINKKNDSILTPLLHFQLVLFSEFSLSSCIAVIWENSPYWTKRWDLAICRFRGRNDITDWEATKLKILSYDDKEIVLAGLKDETWLSAGSEVEWHNRLRSYQAQDFVIWWQRNSPCRTKRWDLAICRFRGRNDVTDWEATKLKILSYDDKGIVLTGLKDETW